MQGVCGGVVNYTTQLIGQVSSFNRTCSDLIDDPSQRNHGGNSPTVMDGSAGFTLGQNMLRQAALIESLPRPAGLPESPPRPPPTLTPECKRKGPLNLSDPLSKHG